MPSERLNLRPVGQELGLGSVRSRVEGGEDQSNREHAEEGQHRRRPVATNSAQHEADAVAEALVVEEVSGLSGLSGVSLAARAGAPVSRQTLRFSAENELDVGFDSAR